VLLARGHANWRWKEMQRKGSGRASRVACLRVLGLGDLQNASAALNLHSRQVRRPDAYGIAQVYAYEGLTDSAFEWLSEPGRQRDVGLTMIKVD